MESVIHFSNGRNEILRGMLHTPELHDKAVQKNLVIFPNGGIMGCEGDFRAYTNMARYIARAGYYVLRFSPAGMGYSDGCIPDCRQKNLYNQIENGFLVPDIIAAVKFVQTIETFSTITLSGICGGAISSFIAAAYLKEVRFVVPIGIPVIMDRDDLDYNTRLPADEANFVLKMYSDKIFSLRAWARLVSWKSDLPRIQAALCTLLRRRPSYIGDSNDQSKFSTNPKFFEAARKIIDKKKKAFFVFGDADGFWWEFERLFLKKHFDGLDKLPFDYYLSPRANHMLTLPEMQVDVVQAMLAWMRRQHLQKT